LSNVRQPVLVIHSRQDHTCALSSVDILRQGLGGSVETLILEDSYHVISVDVDRERVAARVADLVQAICPAEAA
jgi:carboxylesterase